MFTVLAGGTRTYNLSEAIYPKVMEMAEGLGKIGVGIGAIMLLIVVIYYVISMLDGGKFQMKMLVPLLLFFVVCNFNWVSKPLLMFTTTLTESLTKELIDLKKTALNPNYLDDISTINDAYIANHLENDPTSETHPDNQDTGDEASPGAQAPISSASADDVASKFADKTISKITEKVVSDFSTTGNNDVLEKKTSERFSFAGILCQLMSWICSAFAFCLKIFGIMMTSIVVGFGPVTFAFAILPGKGANIASWFIRICQFALYGPLCTFIDTFTSCAYSLLETELAVGWLMVFGLTVANLVGLLSVPTIASMVIEGAAGAVSLSQGLQSIGSATMMSGSFLKGGVLAAAGRDNMFSNFMEGMKHKGVVGFGRSVMDNMDAGDSFGSALGRTFRDIEAYGHGALYNWNDRRDLGQNNNSGGTPSGNAGGSPSGN